MEDQDNMAYWIALEKDVTARIQEIISRSGHPNPRYTLRDGRFSLWVTLDNTEDRQLLGYFMAVYLEEVMMHKNTDDVVITSNGWTRSFQIDFDFASDKCRGMWHFTGSSGPDIPFSNLDMEI